MESGSASTARLSKRELAREGHDTYAADELAIVMSHFDIGVIEQIHEFRRGSRRAPKLLMQSEHGNFLLKRRARGKDDPYKVAFAHQIQLYLTAKQFPLPHLIGTRGDNNSMLQYGGSIYELFEFIKGAGYNNSLDMTLDAGKILALFHKLLRGYQSEYEPSAGSYHAAGSVAASLRTIPRTLAKKDAATAADPGIAELVDELGQAYDAAGECVRELGINDWPMQIIHCDWHPGNMLFRGSHVVAVIDYDAARIAPRIIDVANGALQFSIIGGGDDPSAWPDDIDLSRFKRFVRGYESVPDCILSRSEVQSLSWLMIEALIAESAIPIANTGSFARIDGLDFLQMVRRKIKWLATNADQLTAMVEE